MSNRVVTALADGTVAVFRRDSNTGQWNLQDYHLVRLGGPTNSVRCLTAVTTKVWCGYRNRIHVLDPQTLTLVKSLEAHPRKESQVNLTLIFYLLFINFVNFHLRYDNWLGLVKVFGCQ